MSPEDHPTPGSVDRSTGGATTTLLVPPSRFSPEAACSAPPNLDVPIAVTRARTAEQAGPGQSARELSSLESTWQQRAEQAEQRAAQLEAALISRATIDQAKGVISAVFGLDVDDAFQVLVWVSQHANIKLATIAQRFLDAVRDVDLDDAARGRIVGLLTELAGSTRKHPHLNAASSTY